MVPSVELSLKKAEERNRKKVEFSGRGVIKNLDTLDKRPKIGLITGWSEKIQPSYKEDLKVDFIIKKPFSFSELSKEINDVFFTKT